MMGTSALVGAVELSCVISLMSSITSLIIFYSEANYASFYAICA